MIKTVALSALQAGEQVQLTVGDILRVIVSFNYTVSQDTVAALRACPYHYIAGVLDRIGSCCGESSVELAKSLTPVPKEATVDVPIIAAAAGGIADGTYGLIAEMLGTNVEDHIDNCLVVSGNPAGVLELIPMVIVVMMMSMMMGVIE